AYGLGNHIAEMARQGPTYASVLARFTYTRGSDRRFAVTRAEAVPLHIDVGAKAARVVPAGPVTVRRVAEVLDRRGAVASGLQVDTG
ncbi:MAG: CapA family protein, partial [Geodermatophilales bacterium]|nr:CapA family protein [Geodermatophilales bacterium]